MTWRGGGRIGNRRGGGRCWGELGLLVTEELMCFESRTSGMASSRVETSESRE